MQNAQIKQHVLDLKRENIIERLKTTHKEAYDWLLSKEINLSDLKNLSQNITMALVIVSGLGASSNLITDNTNSFKKTNKLVISEDEFSGLSAEDRASLVWFRYGDIIKDVAKKYALDPKLLFATIMVESGGNTYAYRYEPHIGDASYGLGQILYGTARGMGFTGNPAELYDPATNIELIAKYHKRNIETYGNLTVDELVTAYNSGNPYGYALAGHLQKFNKWFLKANKLMI